MLGVIDLTFSQVKRNVLGSMCDESQVPHIVLGYADTKSPLDWSYSVTGLEGDLAAAQDTVLGSFHWTKHDVAADESIHLRGIETSLNNRLTKL